MEMFLLVTLLVMTQNYIGLVVGNWERENKSATDQWNAKLDKTLRTEAMKTFQNDLSVKMAAKSNLRQYLGPALLLLGDDGLVFVADGSTETMQGDHRNTRIKNAIGGTTESIAAMSSSVAAMQTHIPEIKRDVRDVLTSARRMLARMRLRHASQRVKRFAFQASKNKGLLGLARAPPQGKLPPKPSASARISLGGGDELYDEKKKKKKKKKTKAAPMPTPKPPPDRHQRSVT